MWNSGKVESCAGWSYISISITLKLNFTTDKTG